MQAQVGDDVLILVDPATNNGSDVAPGKIVRIWSTGTTEWGAFTLVNAKGFLDSAGADLWATSAPLYADETAARACLEGNPTTKVMFPKTAVVR